MAYTEANSSAWTDAVHVPNPPSAFWRVRSTASAASSVLAAGTAGPRVGANSGRAASTTDGIAWLTSCSVQRCRKFAR